MSIPESSRKELKKSLKKADILRSFGYVRESRNA